MKTKGYFLIALFLLIFDTVFHYSHAEEIFISNDTYSVRWIAKDDFSDFEWKNRWHSEPEKLCTVSNGKMVSKGTGTIWFKQELPKNIFIQYHILGLSGKSNFNNFFNAKESNGL